MLGIFWEYFNSGIWEPVSFDFHKKYVLPNKNSIDIGGGIGPTMIIGYSFNLKKISVIEADPANYQILKHNYFANYTMDKVELESICISNKTGDIVGFRYTDKSKRDMSTRSVKDDRVRVLTTDVLEVLKTKDLKHTNIIKIDIEGLKNS